MLLGVRVREVRNLAEGAVWVPRCRLLVIDDAMALDERIRVADRLLTEAAALG